VIVWNLYILYSGKLESILACSVVTLTARWRLTVWLAIHEIFRSPIVRHKQMEHAVVQHNGTINDNSFRDLESNPGLE